MGKVILFSRVSTLGQDLTQQNDELYAEAKRNGFTESDIILIEHKESAIKLDASERKGIQELKEIISGQKIDCVIIYEISRLSRRPTVLYSVRDFLIDHSVQLICIKPYMRLLDNYGKMSQTASILFSLFGAISESEMMIKKERMMRGRLAKREQVKFIGGNVMFGYKVDEDDHIVIDDKEKKTVIEIFERYADNESVRSIAKDLIDRGQLRYDDYSTACVMLRRMIRRSEYAGIKGKTYDYPAIISQTLYNKVRARAKSKNKYKTRLSAIYYCQKILYWRKTNMLMSPSKAQLTYRAWDERTNTGIMVNINTMDAIIWNNIIIHRDKISGPERVRMVASLVDEWQHNIQKIEATIMEHNNIEATIERINERVVKGKMSDEQGDRMISEQKERMKELDSNMNRYAELNRNYEQQMKSLQEGQMSIDYNSMDDEQRNEMIHNMTDKITVEKDGLTDKGRFIDILMKDGTEYHWHLIKRGNYPVIYIIENGEEKEISLNIEPRFIRKGAKKICS